MVRVTLMSVAIAFWAASLQIASAQYAEADGKFNRRDLLDGSDDFDLSVRADTANLADLVERDPFISAIIKGIVKLARENKAKAAAKKAEKARAAAANGQQPKQAPKGGKRNKKRNFVEDDDGVLERDFIDYNYIEDLLERFIDGRSEMEDREMEDREFDGQVDELD